MSEEIESIGPYEVVEQIARDSTGRVYQARDPSTGRQVAVKVLPAEFSADPAQLERFRKQVEAVAQLEHPHVVRILDSGEHEGRAYFAMEWVDGVPLSKLLKRRRLTLPEAFGIFKSVALALDHAHARGVEHHDLNPRNILVAEDLSVVKLGDFGISRAASMTGEGDTVTSTSVSRGALHYLAPEQATNPGSVDHRADIYSLGVLLYEMLTGTVPVGRYTLPSRVNSEVPAEVDPLVLKCLEGDPAQRYASVEALLLHVDQLEDRLRLGLASELRGLGRSFRRPTSLVRRRGTLLAIAAIVVLALAATGWTFRESLFGDRREATERPAPTAVQEPEAAVETTPSEDESEDSAETEPESVVEEPEAAPPPAQSTPREQPVESAPPVASREAAAEEEAARLYETAAQRARTGKLDEAFDAIERIRQAHPDSRAAVEALFLRARLEESQKRFDAAMASYTEIGSLTASTMEERATARYRFAKAVLDSETPNGQQLALGVFDEVARAYPETDYAPLALAAKATLEEAENVRVDTEEYGRKVPAAFLTSLALIERYPEHPTAERAFWVVGTEAEDRKDWERAADAFWQLGERFPETRYDAWWRAGQVLDKRLDDTDRALEAYNRVPEGSEHHSDAQKRIARLTK